MYQILSSCWFGGLRHASKAFLVHEWHNNTKKIKNSTEAMVILSLYASHFLWFGLQFVTLSQAYNFFKATVWGTINLHAKVLDNHHPCHWTIAGRFSGSSCIWTHYACRPDGNDAPVWEISYIPKWPWSPYLFWQPLRPDRSVHSYFWTVSFSKIRLVP